MPRGTRITTRDDADDSSQKENTPLSSSVMKQEKARGKRAPVQEPSEEQGEGVEDQQPAGDDDENGNETVDDEEEDGEDGSGSPNGRKRARRGEGGDAIVKGEKGKGKAKERPITLPRDVDGYVPGSIVRIALKNFVTYDETEFFPGANLNMILGPNGTGKSSIACAICLGLNFPPTVLGRATNLNSFVKHGKQTGYIEIELKGPAGKKNLVIRRNLTSGKNSSTFTLNGTSVPARLVDEKLASLNIQVGNLCSFLPQDKVSEFAAMSPQQLLKETQRAAGDERLTTWHETLIQSGKNLGKIQETLHAAREELQTLRDRNAALEKDVKKYHERRTIERQIELLELMLPFMQYVELQCIHREAKAARDTQAEKVKALEAKNEPILNFKKDLEKQQNDIGKQREKKKNAAKLKFETMSEKFDQSDALEKQANDLSDQMDQLKKAEKDRARRIQEGEAKLKELEYELEHPPELEDISAIDQETREVRQQSNDVKAKSDDLQMRQRDNIETESRFNVEIKHCQDGLAQLDNLNHQKLQRLAQWDRDCADAVVWLRNHKQLFQEEVFEPPMISVTVPRAEYTAAVESCFNANQMKSFVFQNQADYDTFNRKVNDSTEALGKKVRVATSFRPVEQIQAPPMSPEQMEHIGFEGYALDFVEYPPAMRFWLMRELNMHRTAISVARNRVDTRAATEAYSASGGGNFIANNVINTVSRSRYGRRLAQNMQRPLRPARNLAQASVDPQVKRQFQARMAEAQANLEEVAAETRRIADADQEIRTEHERLKKIYNDLQGRRKKITDVEKHRSTLTVKITACVKRLDELRNQPSADARRLEIKGRILGLIKNRAEIVKQFTKLVRGAMKDQEDATRLQLQYLQIAANRQAIDETCRLQTQAYDAAKEVLQELAERATLAKSESKVKLAESKAKLEEIDDELRETFRQMEEDGTSRERSSDEIHQALVEERTKLEMNLATNSNVVETYERRQVQIGVLERDVETQEEKESKLQQKIKIARDNWEPALNELVASIGEKFSAAFDRFGCAGEVKITPDEDYEKWAIDILVKFRSTEKLQLLTAQRQSGGERALTTIIYLMSLTEQARAPFSLVDEINQGMDQRAERLVHNQLVEVTCQADSGQYFLITPKLLPSLRYHEKMRVLCVNNGEWLPDERLKGNMMAMVQAFVAKTGGGVARSRN